MHNDIAMCVGLESYPWPHDFSEEAETQGVSKAIPRKAVPYIEPGKTRLVLIHPRACVYVTTPGMSVIDLGLELLNEYVVGTENEPPPEIKKEMVSRWITSPEAAMDDWVLAAVYDRLVDIESDPDTVKNKLGMCYYLREAARVNDLARFEEKYGIKYGLGFFGYTFATGLQYVAKDDEEELPDDLKGTGAEIVRVEYDD
jgi:hypothetical protein